MIFLNKVSQIVSLVRYKYINEGKELLRDKVEPVSLSVSLPIAVMGGFILYELRELRNKKKKLIHESMVCGRIRIGV